MTLCASCGVENRAGAKFCNECGAPLASAAPPREQRKTVTVLFCDVTGSTSLGESIDPEALRALLARYFERMKAVVESHGGSVEKFIGDAVMAVFGVPVAHEDDALRAVRAAVDMRAALPELGVQARIGVNTGEVVTGTAERLATGDAVNVAARLEQAAGPGEILVGDATLALVRDAVEVDRLEPLAAKGKAQPVQAYRLVAVHEVPERRHVTPLVGRASELAQLRAAFERVSSDRSCELFTVVGEPGVGKSRLVREFLSGLDAAVAVGRCPPYGEGISYWPVVEVVKRLRVRPSEPAAAAAMGSLLGETDGEASPEDLAWGFRKTLEEAAAAGPLVVIFDDIQWGEQTFLDLVEAIALLSSGAPILMLCMARPELTERRAGWPVALHLAPLDDDAVEALMPEVIGTELRERIARSAGGNPLFVEEIVSMAVEAGGEVAVPATLQALLAARLDQLDAAERRVLECAAVEGEVFHRGAVQALAALDGQVTPRLAALARQGLIGAYRALFAGEDGFRFRHLLIRDAAYEALTKTSRADLHERLAAWLEHNGEELVELDELLGYHLEQAARYKDELGHPDSVLAERAGSHLATAGRRARWRGDEAAAASLLERAFELTRPHRLDVHLELDFAGVLTWTEPQRGIALAEQAVRRARSAGDRPGEALARVVALERRQFLLGDADVDGLEALAQAALPLLEQANDHAGLARVWDALAFGVANWRGNNEEMARAAQEAIRHARLAGHPRSNASSLALALVSGPTPADEALRTLDAVLPENPRPQDLLLRAVLVAMLGRFDEAWPLAHEANERLSALRGDFEQAWLGEIAMLEGDHVSAARYFRRTYEYVENRGMRTVLAGVASQLALALCALGRYDEGEPLARLGREYAEEADVWAQVLWREAQALVDAASGRYAEAEIVAREAVDIARRGDNLSEQGGTLRSLADVLAIAGRTAEAADALEQALERYDRKKNLAMAAQARARLQHLHRAVSDPA